MSEGSRKTSRFAIAWGCWAVGVIAICAAVTATAYFSESAWPILGLLLIPGIHVKTKSE